MDNASAPRPAAPEGLDLDTVLAVQVGEMVAIRDLWLPLIECDERGCREAQSHRDTCECRCQGAGHGGRWMARYDATRAAVAGRDPFARMPAADDDTWGGLLDARPARSTASVVVTLSADDEPF